MSTKPAHIDGCSGTVTEPKGVATRTRPDRSRRSCSSCAVRRAPAAITFGSTTVVPPANLSEFNTAVDLRPDNNLLVRINAELDKTTGLLTWRFASIDPDTLQPTLDPLAGFLPPNLEPADGTGSVLFTVSPKAGLASGTPINNGARIFFDTNAPIETPVWINTIDNAKPSSSVQPLAATMNSENFAVQWSGTDADSGITNFSIFVSEDGGPFQPWLRNTTDTSAIYPGRQGQSYGFFSMARDKPATWRTRRRRLMPRLPPTQTGAAPSPPPRFRLDPHHR